MVNILNRRRHESGGHYVEYQARVTRQHLLPLYQRLGVPTDGPILDVGCGKGGCAITLAQALDVDVSGIDIRAHDIEVAREAATQFGVKIDFNVLDLTKDQLPDKKYRLLLMRDVVEHLHDIPLVLSRLHEIIDPKGFLYITFPPWLGPYAGHQHNAKSIAKFFPYFHAISPSFFLKTLRKLESDRIDWLADEQQICTNRLTRSKFERIAKDSGWSIYHRNTYFLRPAFMRMGLPTISNGFIGTIPILGEMVSTACEYILRPDITEN